MQLHPTRATFQVALAGAAMVTVGVAAKVAPVVAFGGAMLLAVVLGRALALGTVTRIRSSGFEMVWSSSRRVSRTSRDVEIELVGELRNRGFDDARGVNLRPVASSMLDVRVVPETIDLPAASKVRFSLFVRARRIGRWGVHGVALEVRGTPIGGDGLYEVPLMFANPHGVEVLPQSIVALLDRPRGGRSRRAAEVGHAAPLPGEGDQLREIREHVPGDPFKRIAWKASARRGQLLVREMEREERDVVWLFLDASVELWAGREGSAPLDVATEELAAIASRHLARGDDVGLCVYASRIRSWIPPAAGPGHIGKICAALASAVSMVDADRSECEEPEVAARVLEHLRPLDPRGLADVGRSDLDGLAKRADAMKSRAPFAPRLPLAPTPREQRLRHYLASFGIELPPRIDGERDKAEATLGQILERVVQDKKKRPSVIHVWAPAPTAGPAVERSVRKLRARRIEVRWTMPSFEPGLAGGAAVSEVERVVLDAVRARVAIAQGRARKQMRPMGVHWSRPRRAAKPRGRGAA
ncbi:MAG: DUF58 domain-containing protein [Myxococcales bacterium]|nr:DUF58 domain-containing protein [Myxococcales bacterium]